MLRFGMVVAAWLLLAFPSTAAPNIEVYGQLPSVELMQLSPSGDKLAYIVIAGDNRQLVVKDLSDKVLAVAPAGDHKIRWLDWAGEDHVLVGVSSTQNLGAGIGDEDQEFGQVAVLNLINHKTFMVFSTSTSVLHSVFGYHGAVEQAGHWYGYFGGVTLSKTRGFDATLNNQNWAELYRVDLDSGASVLASPGRQRPHEWALDTGGAVVAHSEYEEATGEWTLRPGSLGGAVLATLKHPFGEISLRGLGRASGTVVVDKAEPEEWSLADGAHAALPHERIIDGYIFDPTTRRLVGIWLAGDRSEQQFYDPILRARQTALRKALGSSMTISSWSADFQKMILYTNGDGDAGTYWLVNGKAVKAYTYPYPDIPDAAVGPTRMITYKAADGLEIHGVLTLPPGREAKGLPLVVLPHGGPQAHDSLGFDWEAQAFASRGYAVFQPNFRGSDGYGLEFRDAGFGQWGRKMQTDISDGVADLAHQGIIDPKRACIVGGSYGGYAALAGVTVQQGLYRCAVSYGGVSDLNYFLNHESPAGTDARNAGTRYLFKFLGVRDNDDASLHALSPARLADRADAPILLIHGADDTVVPVGQSREMERALRRAGKPVEFVELKGEDHWLSRDATRKAMLAAEISFVERNNPAK